MTSPDHMVDGPRVIVLTNEERDSGVMSDKKLYDAIEAFFADGLVVVENAIDVAIIDKLNQRMLQDTEKLLAGQGQVHFKYVWRGRGEDKEKEASI